MTTDFENINGIHLEIVATSKKPLVILSIDESSPELHAAFRLNGHEFPEQHDDVAVLERTTFFVTILKHLATASKGVAWVAKTLLLGVDVLGYEYSKNEEQKCIQALPVYKRAIAKLKEAKSARSTSGAVPA